MSEKENSFSILIPAWNEENILKNTLNRISKLRLPFNYSELIIIAGGEDETLSISKKFQSENFDKIIVMKQDPGDFKSGALIKGLKEVKGDYIAIIDADTLVKSDFAEKVQEGLQKFDALNVDYIPMVNKDIWYAFHKINKEIWALRSEDLSSLFGGATISIKKKILDEIGIEKLFSNKTTAAVDYYFSLVLRENKKKMGLINGTSVLTPRANNIKDFMKDRLRWYISFFQIHKNDFSLRFYSFFLNIAFLIIPPCLYLYNISRMLKIYKKKARLIGKSLKFSLIDYLLRYLTIKGLIISSKVNSRYLGHFKGSRYTES